MRLKEFLLVGCLCIGVACGGGDGDTASPTGPSPLPTVQNPTDLNTPVSGPGLVVQNLLASVRDGNRYEVTFQVREFSLRWPAVITSIVISFDNGGTLTIPNPLAAVPNETVDAGMTVDSRRLNIMETQGRPVATSVTVTVNFRDENSTRSGAATERATVRVITG